MIVRLNGPPPDQLGQIAIALGLDQAASVDQVVKAIAALTAKMKTQVKATMSRLTYEERRSLIQACRRYGTSPQLAALNFLKQTGRR